MDNYILSYNQINKINKINNNQQAELIYIEEITSGPQLIANLTVEEITPSANGIVTIDADINFIANTSL